MIPIDISAEDLAKAPFEMPWGNYLLKELVETTAPEPISWMPQTLGWWLLLTAVFCLVSYRVYRAYKDYQANAYRREALAYLRVVRKNTRWTELPILLKKVALQAYGRERVANLSGLDWEIWLDAACEGSQFSRECQGLLAQLSYQNTPLEQHQIEKLLVNCQRWIAGHKSFCDLSKTRGQEAKARIEGQGKSSRRAEP